MIYFADVHIRRLGERWIYHYPSATRTKYAHDGIITLFAMHSLSIMVISRRTTEHPKYSLIVDVVVIIIMVIGNIHTHSYIILWRFTTTTKTWLIVKTKPAELHKKL